MLELQQHSIICPYCGEFVAIEVDCSEPNQHYIEDCSVCCRPINIHTTIDFDQQVHVSVTHENE
ncbi:CPXCG motif-containing cysteine-rich protein [Candidatus Thioglobus sp.]|jgi:hypothetical protein|uniref:CPXCG motif-containing cysteine-rich protein n=1 Tax=Candidatus Thioglobus sp. TaxID=2026721 RepID=UPI001D8B3AE4|nr:CPXCG motif-containing cysteine-rich protein [Candidatus Thioglobus sp.]MBT3277674.1 CPXCG motif-containing cysteine-rich protein [Candidatus Thioglobus sp.]MBT3446437.1 CPXCG motif-containing cysteine-rich protein [Candidatus Thioglobus sp.]MBT3744341.1 CPXCG motif-containing cysteine-rich protein [Candidatus Thioglobus sp.]MBT4000579.1 CPXCG motif-containing cysteine-rich protein [Candidatus Thioglobus sp.]MBT4181894.1 CPXCG motif-containing cysteine-rich protein [Candidatus Thioglobus sp